MKKILIFFIAISNYSFAQIWSVVGSPNFANSPAVYIFAAVSHDGVPYVVYRDATQTATGTAKKFVGTNWVNVGSRFSSDYVSCPTLAFNSTGSPYVAYMDWANGKKATVKKFDGINWVTVGTEGFTPGAASYTSIAIDSYDMPYVAFRDCSIAYRASVMKFDGTNWVYVGTPGFSSIGGAGGGASTTSLAIDATGTLYVAFSDLNIDFKATVMKFDGSTWVYVGAPGFSAWQANTTSLALDSEGAPYVAYWDRANAGKATVMKFDGNNWVPVGLPGFSPGAVGYTSLAIDNNDVLYVGFEDYANNKKASVMTFNGNTWMYAGSPGFSDTTAQFTTIAIDKTNSILYAAYQDLYDVNLVTRDATVMKYDIATEVKENANEYSMNVYPNPTSSIITINITTNKPKEEFILKVNNASGSTVYSEMLKDVSGSYSKQIDLSHLAKGTYFIELKLTTENTINNNPIVSKKIVLQ